MTLTDYIELFERTLHDELTAYTEPAWIYEPVRYIMSQGGKRVRPVLTLLSAEACGATRESALPAALAVELLHNFTLVHDDIMDRSEKRRGRDTVYVRFGDNAAILSGDVLLGLAMRALNRSAALAPQPLRLHEAFTTGLIDVCDGQALDLEYMERENVSVDDYFRMIERKTAALLELSVAFGAGVAGASSEHTTALNTFAREVGVAFQMQDDILDLTGSEEFGKAPGGDIVEGKRTWLMLTARARATSGTHRTLLDRFFTERGLPREELPAVISMLDELGVLHDARKDVSRRSEASHAALHILPDTPARAMLEELATGLISRTR
jgi:geranylgeranyl diphosphate synthase type II